MTVHRAEKDAVRRVISSGNDELDSKMGGGLPVGSAEVGERYYEMGARFLACGAAIIMLQQGWKRIRSDFDALLQR